VTATTLQVDPALSQRSSLSASAIRVGVTPSGRSTVMVDVVRTLTARAE
jgi:hypothetical protein